MCENHGILLQAADTLHRQHSGDGFSAYFAETNFWVRNVAIFQEIVQILSSHLFSDAIECATDSKDYKRAIEINCWVEGVYVNKRLLNGIIGKDIARYGVGPSKKDDEFIHQNYYQWVIPVLLLQALFMYIPRVIWHLWENGLIGKLLENTGEHHVFVSCATASTFPLLQIRQLSPKLGH